MGLIPDDTISEIRDRADIVAVIGRHVELKKAGRNHKGLCPFHQEKTPSFNVNGDKGFYYCFGCQQKGDVFSFLMEYEGKSFVEAAESLAGMLGMILPESGPSPADARERRSEKGEMLRLNALAAQFFANALTSEAGARARAYLAERGIEGEIATAFRLGCAPAEWRALGDFLAQKNVPMALAAKVGLMVPQPRAGGHYDRFRDRIVCPVQDVSGDVVGFSARRLAEGDDAGAKYINSPESAVYKKSKLLFGVHQAREAFRSAGHALLVEGNFDVISLHQAGFAQAVAPLGTALTEEQASQLRRLVGRVVLLYDGDTAGRAATVKALKTLLAGDVEVHIASLPTGEDPDSILARQGAAALAAVLERAQPAVEYFIHEVWSGADRSAHGRATALGEAAEVLRTISDPTRRDFAVGTLAKALEVDEPTLRRGLRRALQGDRGPGPAPAAPPPRPALPAAPPDGRELAILAILAEYPELLATAEELDVFSCLTDPRLRDMYCAAREGQPIFAATSDPTIAQHVLAGAYASVKDPTSSLKEAVRLLASTRQQSRLAELQRRAEEAKRRGEGDLERRLVREILETRKQVD